MSIKLQAPKFDTATVAGGIVIAAILLLAATRRGLPSPS